MGYYEIVLHAEKPLGWFVYAMELRLKVEDIKPSVLETE
jgi:hypothetical protein